MSEFDPIIRGRFQEWKGLWEDAVRIPSLATDGAAMQRMRDWLTALMQSQGLVVRTLDNPGQPVLLAEDGPRGGDVPTVLVYGHYDVQPAAAADGWDSPPFEPTQRDGRLFGRGTGDNKGQHLAHIFGVMALKERYGTLPLRVKVLLEGDEESGSPYLADVIRRYRSALSADYAITSDGPMGLADRPVIRLGVRGILSFTLRAQGARFDNHSGHKGNVAPNPAWRLVEVLTALKDGEGRVTLPGFYDDVVPLGPRDRDLISRLPFDPERLAETLGMAAEQLAGWDAVEYYRRLMMPTFSITGMGSGYVGPGQKSIIPASAEVRCEFRLAADQKPDRIAAQLKAFMDSRFPDVACDIHPGWMAPSRTDPGHPAIDRLSGAIERAYGVAPYIEPAMGGSLPDYVFTDVLGVPSFIVPLANQDEANHGPNENMRIDLFERGIAASAEMLKALADTPD